MATAADLTTASLEQALVDISKMQDDRGLQLNLKGVTLIVPPELQFQAAKILKSVQVAGGDLNDKNILAGMNIKMSINPYLTDADAWFIKTDCMDGMIRYVREAVTAPTMENDFDTRNAKFACFYQESVGCADPRGIFGSPGA